MKRGKREGEVHINKKRGTRITPQKMNRRIKRAKRETDLSTTTKRGKVHLNSKKEERESTAEKEKSKRKE